MSRWIDADVLHDALKTKQKWVVRCGDKHNEGYTYDQVHFAIDDAPSIDLVRCGECRYYRDFDGCFFSTDGVDENDYCSHGERRTDD